MVTFAERVVTTFNAKQSRGRADDAITMVNPAWHQVVSVYVWTVGLLTLRGTKSSLRTCCCCLVFEGRSGGVCTCCCRFVTIPTQCPPATCHLPTTPHTATGPRLA